METLNTDPFIYNITFDSDQYENKIDYYPDFYSYTMWEIKLFSIYLNRNLKINHKLLINICYLLNKYAE